jgi:hypothetical protein
MLLICGDMLTILLGKIALQFCEFTLLLFHSKIKNPRTRVFY